jgi:hypothetical protein
MQACEQENIWWLPIRGSVLSKQPVNPLLRQAARHQPNRVDGVVVVVVVVVLVLVVNDPVAVVALWWSVTFRQSTT